MCLYTDWKKPRKASKDIIVYKILTNDFKSLFYKKTYTLETLYKLSNSLEILKNPNDAFSEAVSSGVVFDGFHSYAFNIKPSIIVRSFLVVECTIPAGSSKVSATI
jgi:hypothetical protein